MLALWAALGLFGSSGGIDPSTIPATRTAYAALGDASRTAQPQVIWSEPLDPSDELPFLFRFDQVLDEGDTIASLGQVVIGPSPAGLALGLTLTDEALSADSKGIAFTATVDPAYHANAAFEGAGALLGVEAAVTTAAGHLFERTIYLRVVQL